MITVSQEAAIELIQLLKNEDKTYVRVSVKGGGCSGLMYDLSLEEASRETDTICEDKNIKILVDNKSLLYLVGTELNYTSGLNGKGFHFINPNASRSCGCGESFAV